MKYNCGTYKIAGETAHYTHTREFKDGSIILSMMLNGDNMPIKWDSNGKPIEWEFIEGTKGN